MIVTLLSILALAVAFAYLLWSIGAQYPDRTLRCADRPDREERMIRRGSDASQGPQRPGRLRRVGPPGLDDPGVPTRVSVDRGLARVMIDEAAAAGAARRKVGRAVRQLERGDRRVASGKHEQAIVRYGRAWSAARAALDEVSRGRS